MVIVWLPFVLYSDHLSFVPLCSWTYKQLPIIDTTDCGDSTTWLKLEWIQQYNYMYFGSRRTDTQAVCHFLHWWLYLPPPLWSYWSFGPKYLLCWSMAAQTAVPCQIRTSLSDGRSHTLTDLLAGRVSLRGFAATMGRKIEEVCLAAFLENVRELNITTWRSSNIK